MIRSPIYSAVRPPGRSGFSRAPGEDVYSLMRAAAIDAARRNNAALWFVEQDRRNIFVNSDGSGGNPPAGGIVGLLVPPDPLPMPELFTGGDASVIGTWANTGGTISLENGEFKLTTSGAYGGASRVIPTVAGKWYKCTVTYRSGLGNPANVFLRPGGADVTTAQVQFPSTTGLTPETHTRYIRATGSQMWIRLTSLLNGGGDVAYFDNISFQEVGGLVLDSPSTSQKPIVTQPGATDPNRVGLRFDGTDDRMRASISPLSPTVGNPYTLIFSGQLATLTGPRMAVCDGRGLGMDGNSTIASGNTLHGGTTRWSFGQTWPLNTRRVLTATYRRTPDLIRQRVSGAEVNSAEIAPTSQITPEMFIGARSPTQEFWQGDIFLACAAPNVMPLADIQAIERFAGFIGGATVA